MNREATIVPGITIIIFQHSDVHSRPQGASGFRRSIKNGMARRSLSWTTEPIAVVGVEDVVATFNTRPFVEGDRAHDRRRIVFNPGVFGVAGIKQYHAPTSIQLGSEGIGLQGLLPLGLGRFAEIAYRRVIQ